MLLSMTKNCRAESTLLTKSESGPNIPFTNMSKDISPISTTEETYDFAKSTTNQQFKSFFNGKLFNKFSAKAPETTREQPTMTTPIQ